MKKFARVIALAALIVLGGHAMGQHSHGYLFVGASFPMSEFKDGNVFSNTALGGNYNDGGAGLGVNAGLKWDYGVGVPGLSVMLSVDGLYNAQNADMKNFYKQEKNDWGIINNNVEVSTPKYINVPAMLGLNYCIRINPQLGIYVEGGVGGNLRFITDYAKKGSSKMFNLKNSCIYDYEKALTFAWQAGLGIEVSKSLVIGCSFYDLGGAPVKGELKTIVEGLNSPTVDFEYGTDHPIMVLGRLGFRF